MENSVPGTLVPLHFLEALGFLNVRQTELDRAVDRTIGYFTGLDNGRLNAILSPIMNLSTRLEMLQNLIPLSNYTPKEKCKFETIRREVLSANGQRNRLLHDIPYSYSPSDDTLGYIRKKTYSIPQVRISPIIEVTPAKIIDYGNEMWTLQIWLGLPFFTDLEGNFVPHPHWSDDDKFPWPDKYAQLLPKFDPSLVGTRKVQFRRKPSSP